MEGDDPRWSRDDEPPPNGRSQAERLSYWSRLMRDAKPRDVELESAFKSIKQQAKRMGKDATRSRSSLPSIGTSFAYLCVFCAASLLLCFVLWVASCTLKSMKGV